MSARALALLEKGRDALFYGGEWHKPFSSSRMETVNPANGGSIGSVVDANEQDVDAAVEAAKKAFKSWRSTTPAQRAAYMFKAAKVLREHAEELAYLDALDAGLPIARLLTDVEMAAAQI